MFGNVNDGHVQYITMRITNINVAPMVQRQVYLFKHGCIYKKWNFIKQIILYEDFERIFTENGSLPIYILPKLSHWG